MEMESNQLITRDSQPTPRPVTYDALVLDAGLPQSLMTVRSLGSRGLRVAALETFAGAPTFSSRWCQKAFVCPADVGTEEYLAYLEQVLDWTGARVLITSSDGTIAFIRRHREELEQKVRIALAREPALGIAMNKEQTQGIAKKLGVSVPRGVKVKAVDGVEAALREVGLPAVVKPVESWDAQHRTSMKSELVTTPDEARRAVEKLTRFGGATLFQQFLPGERESMGLLHANGQVYARFVQWTKRSVPPLGGTSVVHQCIAVPPDIGPQAERLVREIDLEGYCQLEFRRDAAGHPYLMEINPRLNLTIENAVYAGVDFPYLLYQWASGDQINVVNTYLVGGWMRDLGGDMMATIQALQQRGRPGVNPPAKAIRDFCASFFMPMRYAYVDWKDPLPAVIATANFTRRWVARALMKRLSRLRCWLSQSLRRAPAPATRRDGADQVAHASKE
jgi:predicted ATP-grasp superfamily ATP-dependent carboligase